MEPNISKFYVMSKVENQQVQINNALLKKDDGWIVGTESPLRLGIFAFNLLLTGTCTCNNPASKLDWDYRSPHQKSPKFAASRKKYRQVKQQRPVCLYLSESKPSNGHSLNYRLDIISKRMKIESRNQRFFNSFAQIPLRCLLKTLNQYLITTEQN